MSLDRFVHFNKVIPTKEYLKSILEIYLGGMGEIECKEHWWIISLPGTPTDVYGRLTQKDMPESRWFEVFIALGSKNPNIDVITRHADELTNVIAAGYAELVRRFCQGEDIT